jgi:hypothetical protein
VEKDDGRGFSVMTNKPIKNKDDREALAIANWIKNIVVKPVEGYSWVQAMTEAGYSSKYANDQGYKVKARCQDRIDAKTEKVLNKKQYNLEYWQEQLTDLYSECRADKDKTNAKGLVDMGIKLNQGYITITKDITAPDTVPEQDKQALTAVAADYKLKLAE